MAKNSSHPRETQKQVFIARKFTRDPKSLNSLKRPTKDIRPQQTKAHEQVTKHKRICNEDIFVHTLLEPVPKRPRKLSTQIRLRQEPMQSSVLRLRKSTGEEAIDCR